MQRTRVAFYLYLVENGLNIVLAVLLVHPLGVRGLALSLSIAYTVAAVLALAVFRQWFGRLAERETWAPLVRVLIASRAHGRRRPGRVQPLGVDQPRRACWPGWSGRCVAGGLTFGAVVIWLGRRHDTAPASPAGGAARPHRAPPSGPVRPGSGPPGARERPPRRSRR